jgi:hypothetical protein
MEAWSGGAVGWGGAGRGGGGKRRQFRLLLPVVTAARAHPLTQNHDKVALAPPIRRLKQHKWTRTDTVCHTECLGTTNSLVTARP